MIRHGAAGRPALGALLLVLLLALATWLPRLRGPLDLRFDGGVYYTLGVSLAEGRGYRLLNEPGEIHAVQYPPLLPLLVAAHVKLLGTTDPVVVGESLRRTYLVLSLLYALGVYLTGRAFVSDRLALLATALTLGYCYTYFLSDLLFTELPFALLTILLVLAQRLPEPARTSTSTIAGTGAVLLRASGIALLLAWTIDALLSRRFGAAALRAAVTAVPLLAWQGYVHGVRSGPEYAAPSYAYQRAPYLYYNVSYTENMVYRDPFRPELGRIGLGERVVRTARNAALLPQLMGEAVSAPQRFWEWAKDEAGRWTGFPDVRSYDRLATALVGLVVLGGLLVLVARGGRLVALYVTLTLGLVLTTPWPAQFTRYFAPLTPFLTVALVLALDTLRQVASRCARAPRVLLSGAAATLVVSVISIQALTLYRTLLLYHQPATWLDARGRRSEARLFYYDRAWRAFDLALEWLRREGRAGAVVGSSAPHDVYLRTGFKSVMLPMEADVEAAQRLLDGVPVTYLIVDDLAFADISRRYGRPLVEGGPADWELLYSGEGRLRIYGRRGRPAS